MKLCTTADIGGRLVGDGHPAFITFEGGPTHNGVETAKKLADMARASGADAIKFQMTNPERLVADRKQLFSYSVLVDRETGRTEEVAEPLYDILMRRYLTHDQWREVKRHCDSIGLTMFATVGFPEDLAFLVEIGCPSVKIPSADVNHFPMIRAAARTGLNIQLDTGNARIGEVEEAIDLIVAEGGGNVVIHHCPSGYPARLDGINLRVVQTLKSVFGCPVAFSDHSPGRDMDVAAIALGANMVEKTITLDRTTRSVEHMFSLEQPDMAAFVAAVRAVEAGLGQRRRTFTAEEAKGRFKLRRSAFLKAAAAAGTPISEALIEWRRPGDGINPNRIDEIVGRPLAVDLPAGAKLSWKDIG